jgi:predicted secreted protein
MAPMRGNKNKNIIRDLELKAPEEIETIPEEPQTSKDAELEALRKEVETLTEALRSQQWHTIERRIPISRIPLPNRTIDFKNGETTVCEVVMVTHGVGGNQQIYGSPCPELILTQPTRFSQRTC